MHIPRTAIVMDIPWGSGSTDDLFIYLSEFLKIEGGQMLDEHHQNPYIAALT
jgi:hypothetical protein